MPPPPHLRAKGSVPQRMWSGVLALCPAVASLMIFFRFEAFRLLVVATAGAILAELAVRRLLKKRARLYDGSVVMSALLLALLLPPTLPSWKVVLGAAFAVIFGKEIFGGLGQNPFNPALVGCAFLFNAFPFSMDFSLDTLEGSRLLAFSLATLAGGLFLTLRCLIRWEVPWLYLGTVFLFSFALGQRGEEAIFRASVLLAAFFLITDPVTTPLTRVGEGWFAFGAGLFTVLLGQGLSYTKGVTYGVLLMNALVPWIDRWLPPRPSRPR